MLQLLWAFSTLNALSIKLGNASLRKTDIADSLLSHTLWDGIMRTLDYRLLGNTDLILMVLVFKCCSVSNTCLTSVFLVSNLIHLSSSSLICSWVLCERGLHSADLDL